MNESIIPSSPGTAPPAQRRQGDGVHVDLKDLIRIQFKARGFSFLPRQPVHSILAGRHSSRLRGRGLNFEELRRYLPGDDIRNIDWHVTARVQKPYVRVYTEERDRPVLLLVDQRQSMFFASQGAMKSVIAAEAAALAAWRAIDVGDRVGAVIFSDDELVEIKPHRSNAHVMRILDTITRLNHQLNADSKVTPNPKMYDRALDKATHLATHDFLVCTISDGFGLGEESKKHGTRIAAHNDLLALFVYDPIEKELPSSGTLVFGQGNQQLEVNTGKDAFRKRFTSTFEERFEMIERFCRQRAVPRIPIRTDRDVAEQIRDHLGFVPKG